MNQPPGAPPGAWVPRTDAGARKLIETVELVEKRLSHRMETTEQQQDEVLKQVRELVGEVKRMDAELKQKTDEKRVFAILGGVAFAVLGLFWGITWQITSTRAADMKDAVTRQAESSQKEMKAELEKARLTQQLEMRELYQVTPKKKRSPLLEKPPAETGEGE